MPYFGAPLALRTLVPDDGARIMPTRFDDWVGRRCRYQFLSGAGRRVSRGARDAADRYFGRRIARLGKVTLQCTAYPFPDGVALGLSLALLLGLIDAFHVRDLVAKSGAPAQTALMLVTTYGLMFGIGAALTGLVLTLEDETDGEAGSLSTCCRSTAQAGDRAGNDLHGDADHPSGHDHRYPCQMRIVAQHDHADASEG